MSRFPHSIRLQIKPSIAHNGKWKISHIVKGHCMAISEYMFGRPRLPVFSVICHYRIISSSNLLPKLRYNLSSYRQGIASFACFDPSSLGVSQHESLRISTTSSSRSHDPWLLTITVAYQEKIWETKIMENINDVAMLSRKSISQNRTFSIMVFLLFSLQCILYPMNTNAQVSPDAQVYISEILRKQVPYEVNILDCTFKINSVNTYPPGKLSLMFAKYLIDNNFVKNRTIVDAGAGCFALGIISAKHGAKLVMGIDVAEEAVQCAHENIVNNAVEGNASILQGNGLDLLIPKYNRKIDLLLAGVPWDTLSLEEFNALPDDRKSLSRAFYDVDNKLIADVLMRGPLLLSPHGRIFITASKRTMARLKKICDLYKVKYQIVKQEDIHRDGNIHYILEIKFK